MLTNEQIDRWLPAISTPVLLIAIWLVLGSPAAPPQQEQPAQGGLRCFVNEDAKTLTCFTQAGQFTCSKHLESESK